MEAGAYPRSNSCSDFQGMMQMSYVQTQYLQQNTLVKEHPVEDALSSRILSREDSERLELWTKVLEKEIHGRSDGGDDSLWKRVKWTDGMVKLMITALSYIKEGTCKSPVLLVKMGKWRAISTVMGERGFTVSPQQCEDKFNDLNKKYKRLIFLLSKSISCTIVESPTLLDLMNLPSKVKEEVQKILNSKHFLYREMCSFYHGNRVNLPHDRKLQRSLMLLLNGKNDFNLYVEYGMENGEGNAELSKGESSKRPRQENKNEPWGLDSQKSEFHIADACLDANDGHLDIAKRYQLENKWMSWHCLKLEDRKLEIQKQRLELEKERLEWLNFSQRENNKLNQMRLEIESMKLANARLALELKRQEMAAHHN